jgi:DNA topoisomerase-1
MQRRGKFGRTFYGCDRYPKCDYIVNELTQAEANVPDDGATPGSARPTTRSVGSMKQPVVRATKPKAAVSKNGKVSKTTARTTSSRSVRSSTKKTKA